jgi:serine/threonine protein kinase
MSSTSPRAQPEVTDATPQLIDARYDVERLLGRGGMSVVYAVRDRHSGRRCALKQLAPRTEAHRAQLSAQFRREYAILGQLAHPSIVTVHDYGILRSKSARCCARSHPRSRCCIRADSCTVMLQPATCGSTPMAAPS